MKITQYAYLAGLIDGEGYLGLTKRSDGWRARIILSNCNLKLLQTVKGWLPGCITKKPKRENWNQGYNLALYGVRDWLPFVIPHMVAKRRKAELFLQALDMLHKRQKQTTGAKKMYLPEIEKINKQMRLNEWDL